MIEIYTENDALPDVIHISILTYKLKIQDYQSIMAGFVWVEDYEGNVDYD